MVGAMGSKRRGRGPRSCSPFAMVHWMILDSQGWHELTPYARLAYVEIVRKHNPIQGNNGRIAMPARGLAGRLACSKATAARALTELEDAGFIKCMKVGTFTRKDRHASEYRINIFRCDVTGDTPNRAWDNTKWEPPDGLTHETVRSHLEQGTGSKPTPQSHPRDREAQNGPSHGLTHETHLDSTMGDTVTEVSINADLWDEIGNIPEGLDRRQKRARA